MHTHYSDCGMNKRSIVHGPAVFGTPSLVFLSRIFPDTSFWKKKKKKKKVCIHAIWGWESWDSMNTAVFGRINFIIWVTVKHMWYVSIFNHFYILKMENLNQVRQIPLSILLKEKNLDCERNCMHYKLITGWPCVLTAAVYRFGIRK